MPAIITPRFKSREAALRFYFRLVQLLTPNTKPGVYSTRRRPRVHHGTSIVDDLFALDSCFHGMNDVQLSLLHELYCPAGFSVKPPPIADMLEAVRCKFPKHQLNPN